MTSVEPVELELRCSSNYLQLIVVVVSHQDEMLNRWRSEKYKDTSEGSTFWGLDFPNIQDASLTLPYPEPAACMQTGLQQMCR